MLPTKFYTSHETAETKAEPHKSILVNGDTVIEHHICNSHKPKSFFSSQHTLIVVLNGTIHLNYGSEQHMMSSGQLAIVKRNILFEYKCIGEEDDEKKTELLLFNLSYDLIKEFTLLAALPATMQVEPEDILINTSNSRLGKYIDSILACVYCPQQMDNSFIKIKLLELLFILSGSYPSDIANLLLDQRKSYRPDITAVVEENIMNTLSVQELAVLAGRSLSSFRRDFLSIYNMPPSQWIREKRLKKAKDFLISTNMTITDICYTLGFENIAHFSRLFKSQFGHSPTAYRLQVVSA